MSILSQIDSFMQLAYLKDADAWLTWLMQRGKAAECIENDILLGRPDWLPENVRRALPRTSCVC